MQAAMSLGPLAEMLASTVNIVVQIALFPAASIAVTVMGCVPTPTSVPAAGD
jgi:hypothetical protein